LGIKIDENVVPGPIRDQVSIQTPQNVEKSAKKGLDFMQPESVLGGILKTFRHFFAGLFLMFYGDVPFSVRGSIWAPKASERVAKGSPKSSKTRSKAIVQNMRKAWQALYGRHIGRFREGRGTHFFRDAAKKPLQKGPERGLEGFFVIWGLLWELSGAPFRTKKVI